MSIQVDVSCDSCELSVGIHGSQVFCNSCAEAELVQNRDALDVCRQLYRSHEERDPLELSNAVSSARRVLVDLGEVPA